MEIYFVILIYITSSLHSGSEEVELFRNGKRSSLEKHPKCTAGNKNKA